MKILSESKGFTFVELLIVSAIAMIVLGLSTPFVLSLRSDVHLSQRIKQVKSDLVATMSYAVSGKSFAALVKGGSPDINLMPSRYGLFFQKDSGALLINDYFYFETKTDPSHQKTDLIYQYKNEPPNPTVHLKSIRLIDSANSAVQVDSVALFFTPPFGEVIILNGNLVKKLFNNPSESFDAGVTFNDSNRYKKVEMDFQFKDEERTLTTLTFDLNKVINIL